LSKHIFITFTIGEEVCNTVKLPEFKQHPTYSDALYLYCASSIKIDNRQLDFGISIDLPKIVARDFDLAAKKGTLDIQSKGVT